VTRQSRLAILGVGVLAAGCALIGLAVMSWQQTGSSTWVDLSLWGELALSAVLFLLGVEILVSATPPPVQPAIPTLSTSPSSPFTAPTPQELAETQRIILEELRRTFVDQVSSADLVINRATTLLSILVGTLAGALAIERALVPSVPLWYTVLLCAASAVLLAVLRLFPSTLFPPTKIDIGGKPESLQMALGRDPAGVRAELIQDYVRWSQGNRIVIEQRQAQFKLVGMLLWVAATLLVVTSIALYVTSALGLL
jgi:magnesium-transporting ATPase (P-type)